MKTLTLILLLFTFNVFADTAEGTFTPPTKRVDGSVLASSDIGGYKIYIDGIEQESRLSSDATTFSLVIPAGEHTLNLTTLDSDGRESVKSETITISGGSNPNAPSSIIVIIRL